MSRLRFEKTCEACPEQYDVFEGDKRVGYVRLRFGWLVGWSPDLGGEVVYEDTIGDSGWDGCFESDEQRKFHLDKIEEAIRRHIDGTN